MQLIDSFQRGNAAKRKGFTLLELIIVIAIITALVTLLVLVLNPAELMRRSRDSRRLSDLDALKKAIELSLFEGADPDGPYDNACAGESDPRLFASVPLPPEGEVPPFSVSGWTITQPAVDDLQKVDGNGWVPMALGGGGHGSLLASLPIDPVNAFSENLYYTYTCQRNPHFELTARFESTEYRRGGIYDIVSQDGGDDPFVYELGTNRELDPTAPVAYWPFDDRSGMVAKDQSGNGYDAALVNGPIWDGGRFGGGIKLDGIDDYVISPDLRPAFSEESVTVSLWFAAINPNGVILDELGQPELNTGWHDAQAVIVSNQNIHTRIWMLPILYGVGNASLNQWHQLVLRYNKASQTHDAFFDGVKADTSIPGDREAPWESGYDLYYALGAADSSSIGSTNYFSGRVDNVLVYNRALTDQEIVAQYKLSAPVPLPEGALGFLEGEDPATDECLADYPSGTFHACFYDGLGFSGTFLKKYVDAPWKATENGNVWRGPLHPHPWPLPFSHGTWVSGVWRGTFNLPPGGYAFLFIQVEDKVRVYVDDKLIIDEWDTVGINSFTGTKVVCDSPVQIRIEWAKSGNGLMNFLWYPDNDAFDSEPPCP